MVLAAPHSQSASSLDEPFLLVVDDEEIIRASLEKILLRQGYRVLAAENGESAIKILQTTQVGLIICDLRLPGLSGVEVLAKARELQPDAIRIILTGMSDLNTIMAAVNYAHVNQILLKPWEEFVLNQTVKSGWENYHLVKENERLQRITLQQHKNLQLAHSNLQKEMQIGGRIHEVLLVGQVPNNVSGVEIEAETIPSKEIDGDFFEFYEQSDAIMDLIIGDVMGKGLPAALVGTALKTQLIQYAVPFYHAKVFKKFGQWEDDLLTPKEIILHLHHTMAPKLIDLEYFASLFYGRFHLLKKTFTFVDCGSTKPIHYSAKNKRSYFLKGKNMPLGSFEDQTFQSNHISFAENDIFIFYSDGLTEAKSPKREQYGPERIVDIVEKHPEASPRELIQRIKSSVISFVAKSAFEDDLTLIVIKIAQSKNIQQAKMKSANFTADLSELSKVRNYIHNLCINSVGDTERLSELLQLAIDEAFCNVVHHGYKNNKKGSIIIKGIVDAEGITIEIADQGEVYDPSRFKTPNLNEYKENGYGLFLINKIADSVVYIEKKSEGGWNHMFISKKYLTEGKNDD